MNRRDTITVAVLLNAVIIAVLLIMAVNTNEEPLYEREAVGPEASVNAAASPLEIVVEAPVVKAPGSAVVIDLESTGFDNMLGEYATSPEEFFMLDDELSVVTEKMDKPVAPVESKVVDKELDNVKMVDVVVKKGDSLDKIARANGTTIEAIKSVNQLKSANLSIGQKLKVPVGYKKPAASPSKTQQAQQSLNSKEKPQGVEYYTVKSGDTPWKIARQQQVSMDDILRLNRLNEEKARNLKIGDRIRIR